MPVYEYLCQDCQQVIDKLKSYEDRDVPEKCSCGGIATRAYLSMPSVTRASYIDSKKTARAKELQDLKQAAKLEVERADMRPEERKEINKAINRLRKAK